MHISQGNAESLLSRHGWLAQLPTSVQSDLLQISTCIWLDEGATLYHAEDPAGGMYGLASGCVEFDGTQSPNFVKKGYLGHPGMWFGFGMVAGKKGRLTGVRTTRPSTVLSIGYSEFRAYSEKNPDIWRELLLLQIQITGEVIGLAQDLMRRNSRDRLAAVLARLAGLRTPFPPFPAKVDVTQNDLAMIANLSRSSISPILLEMEREGLIGLRRASIEILEPAELLKRVEI